MTTSPQIEKRKARLNPFAFPSDTDFRFVTLIVGVLGTSLLIYDFIYSSIPINALAFIRMYQHCVIVASKLFPGSSFADQQAAFALFTQCIAPVQHNEGTWLCLGLALVLTVSLALYWILPAWKIWRGGLKVLHTQNAAPAMLTCLSNLCDEAGLRRKPVFLLNPYSAARSGLTFGRFRRYYVVLNSGLVLLFSLDQPAFRAIVLHELGHVRNADIDKTYLTITVGWAFVIAALIPWTVMQFVPPWRLYTLGIAWRILVLSIFIYLTRNAILRTREVYADVRASVWDERDIQKRQSEQAGALNRVISNLPSAGKGHWRYLFRNHPDPQERYRVLNDTSQLFKASFWDAFAVGLVVTIGISGVNFLLYRWEDKFQLIGQATEVASAIISAVLAALLIAGIIGSGIWRATFASLLGGTTPRAVQLSVALVLGLLLGQALSISSVEATSISGLPSLLPEQLTLSGLIDQAAFLLIWDVLLLFMLFLLLRWLRVCPTTWLNVAMSGSAPGWTYWIALMLAAIILGTWLDQLSNIQIGVQAILNPSDPTHAAVLDSLRIAGISSQDIRVSVILFALLELASEPLICLSYICVWAYPLASWLWRKRQPGTGNASWVWLDTSPQAQKQALSAQDSMHPGLALIMGLAGGLAFCGLYPLFTRTFQLTLSGDETIVLAALLQAGVAAIIAGRAERLGVIQGLFSAFVAGCIMAAGIVVFSLLYDEQTNFPSPWGIFLQVVNSGALASLLITLSVSMLSMRIRRFVRPVSGTRVA